MDLLAGLWEGVCAVYLGACSLPEFQKGCKRIPLFRHWERVSELLSLAVLRSFWRTLSLLCSALHII